MSRNFPRRIVPSITYLFRMLSFKREFQRVGPKSSSSQDTHMQIHAK